MRRQNFFKKSCKFFLISSLVYAVGGLEAFVKVTSWPYTQAIPEGATQLEMGGKLQYIPPKAFSNSSWIQDLFIILNVHNVHVKKPQSYFNIKASALSV